MTVTFADGTHLTQTLAYQFDGSNSSAGLTTAPVSAASWPTVRTPDTLSGAQATIGSRTYQVSLASGGVTASHALAGAATGQPLAGLVYSSTAADARPIVLASYTLDPVRLVPPTTVTAQLTLNGVAGSAVVYDTSHLNPGDTLQLALPGDATALASGR